MTHLPGKVGACSWGLRTGKCRAQILLRGSGLWDEALNVTLASTVQQKDVAQVFSEAGDECLFKARNSWQILWETRY